MHVSQISIVLAYLKISHVGQLDPWVFKIYTVSRDEGQLLPDLHLLPRLSASLFFCISWSLTSGFIELVLWWVILLSSWGMFHTDMRYEVLYYYLNLKLLLKVFYGFQPQWKFGTMKTYTSQAALPQCISCSLWAPPFQKTPNFPLFCQRNCFSIL